MEDGDGSDRAALLVLARELESGKGPSGSGAIYARAFTGYSLVAEGLADPAFAAEAAGHVDRLAAQVAAVKEKFGTGQVTVGGRRLSSSAVLRGHLALLLVGRRALGGMAAGDLALEEALVRGLAADVHADKNHLLPSYGRRTWPADNEVILAALRLHRELAGPDEQLEAAAGELEAALAAITTDGLPASEVEPDALAGKDVPRGCALSWSVAFRGLHDPGAAASLWASVRKDYLVHVGPAVGVREWPPGVDRKADVDSGPILLGIGAAASAFALPATRLAGAQADHLALRASAQLAGLKVIEEKRGTEQLPRAIALWGRVARARGSAVRR